MSDIAYKYRARAKHTASRTASYVLIRRFLNKKSTTSADERRLLHDVLRSWRVGLVQLRRAGWSEVDSATIQFLRNCPPVAAYWSSPESGVICGRCHICPWCWARSRVLEPFNRFEVAFAKVAGRELRNAVDSEYCLLEAQIRRLCHVNVEDLETDFETLHQRWSYESRLAWNTYLKTLGAAAAFTSFTIEPVLVGASVIIRWRALALAPLEVADDHVIIPRLDLVTPGLKLKTGPASRIALSRALGRLALYPRNLMWYQRELGAAILNSKSRRRQTACFGALRGLRALQKQD